MKSEVSIVKGKDVEKMVAEALELIGGIESVVKKGDKVLIKPNVHGPHPLEDHITTDPRLVVAVANQCHKAGAKEVLVGEAPSLTGAGATIHAYEISGMKEAIEKSGAATLVDLETDEYVDVKVPGGFILKNMPRPKSLISADVVISTPVMKTHHGARVTGSLKNMMGTLNREGKSFIHEVGLHESIADINKARKIDLVVADMITCMEGLGPIAGRTVNVQPDGSHYVSEIVGGVLVPMDVIVASKDPVACDATCCRIMKIDPTTVNYIPLAYKHGLGNMRLNEIQVKGLQIKDVARAFAQCPTDLDEFADYIIPHTEGACFGCLAYEYFALENMRARGLLDRAKGLHVVMGPKEEIPDEWKSGGDLLLLGNCLTKFSHMGMFGAGCPPSGRPFMVGTLMRSLSPEAHANAAEVRKQHPTPLEIEENKKLNQNKK